MPQFEDFLATLDESKIQEMLGYNKKAYVWNLDVLNEHNVKLVVSEIQQGIEADCIAATIGILRLYHEWLSEQL